MKIGSLNAVGSEANQDSVRSEAAISRKRVDTSGRASAMACQGFGPVFEDDADAYLLCTGRAEPSAGALTASVVEAD